MARVSLKKGKPAEYKRVLLDNIYEAMCETFNCPEDDKFMLLTEHEGGDFVYSQNYLDIARTDDLVFIQITCNNTRTLEMKKALYKRVAERLLADLQLRPQDVFISLVEVAKENWSLGNGEAQYAR